MRVAVIASRFPWPSYTGDRMRTATWLAALARHARVALIAPAGEVPAEAPPFAFFPAARSFSRAARAAFTVIREDLPLQSLLAAPYAWGEAIAAAHRASGGFDAMVVVLSRADPWVRGSLDGGVRILDAVDSLQRNAEEREKASSMPMRWLWREEARRLKNAQRDVAHAYDRIVVVNRDERADFSSDAVAIPNSVPVLPLDTAGPRPYDFGFWGRLAYFANADAARWLMREIWPAIRQRLPSATMVLAGADAPRALVREARRQPGIELISPVENMSALARSVRVAVMPVRYGSGQATKVLEAAEAGCAMVATTRALRGLDSLAPHACIADDAASIARAAAELLANENVRAAKAHALRAAVAANHSRERVLEQLVQIATGTSRS